MISKIRADAESEFKDVQSLLNGFGRSISYKTENGKSSFLNMVEGELANGLLKGYGRKLNSKGECKVGFWDVLSTSSGSKISVPHGKWAWYTKDGKQKVPENYYIGK